MAAVLQLILVMLAVITLFVILAYRELKRANKIAQQAIAPRTEVHK
jgi:preprotein translocase subunit YajC